MVACLPEIAWGTKWLEEIVVSKQSDTAFLHILRLAAQLLLA